MNSSGKLFFLVLAVLAVCGSAQAQYYPSMQQVTAPAVYVDDDAVVCDYSYGPGPSGGQDIVNTVDNGPLPVPDVNICDISYGPQEQPVVVNSPTPGNSPTPTTYAPNYQYGQSYYANAAVAPFGVYGYSDPYFALYGVPYYSVAPLTCRYDYCGLVVNMQVSGGIAPYTLEVHGREDNGLAPATPYNRTFTIYGSSITWHNASFGQYMLVVVDARGKTCGFTAVLVPSNTTVTGNCTGS